MLKYAGLLNVLADIYILKKYQLSEQNDKGEIGFCWCGFCRTKRMVKPYEEPHRPPRAASPIPSWKVAFGAMDIGMKINQNKACNAQPLALY